MIRKAQPHLDEESAAELAKSACVEVGHTTADAAFAAMQVQQLQIVGSASATLGSRRNDPIASALNGAAVGASSAAEDTEAERKSAIFDAVLEGLQGGLSQVSSVDLHAFAQSACLATAFSSPEAALARFRADHAQRLRAQQEEALLQQQRLQLEQELQEKAQRVRDAETALDKATGGKAVGDKSSGGVSDDAAALPASSGASSPSASARQALSSPEAADQAKKIAGLQKQLDAAQAAAARDVALLRKQLEGEQKGAAKLLQAMEAALADAVAAAERQHEAAAVFERQVQQLRGDKDALRRQLSRATEASDLKDARLAKLDAELASTRAAAEDAQARARTSDEQRVKAVVAAEAMERAATDSARREAEADKRRLELELDGERRRALELQRALDEARRELSIPTPADAIEAVAVEAAAAIVAACVPEPLPAPAPTLPPASLSPDAVAEAKRLRARIRELERQLALSGSEVARLGVELSLAFSVQLMQQQQLLQQFIARRREQVGAGPPFNTDTAPLS